MHVHVYVRVGARGERMCTRASCVCAWVCDAVLAYKFQPGALSFTLCLYIRQERVVGTSRMPIGLFVRLSRSMVLQHAHHKPSGPS